MLIVCRLRGAITGLNTEHLEEKCWAGSQIEKARSTAYKACKIIYVYRQPKFAYSIQLHLASRDQVGIPSSKTEIVDTGHAAAAVKENGVVLGHALTS